MTRINEAIDLKTIRMHFIEVIKRALIDSWPMSFQSACSFAGNPKWRPLGPLAHQCVGVVKSSKLYDENWSIWA
ncbi:MAG: hypothetical protein ACREX0_06595 [Noviherbaspirillum sp.]